MAQVTCEAVSLLVVEDDQTHQELVRQCLDGEEPHQDHGIFAPRGACAWAQTGGHQGV